ncbi:hypothetical protein FCU45_07920 [Sulfurimonas crateris]|uniref:Uncharacterized protein n=1 Tax=Sulfurimonas crateris TaxID=2574727 RepID=A0A4U2Z606_9BACT|nr:hypothetical protein [Sulfurimonas crateris]TKI68882.1 hypothetical protein FCU45_07920 [Sulfurimonas crateris]
MQKLLIKSMQDINNQIKELDKEFDYLVISELRRKRFYIFSTYRHLHNLGYFTGSQKAVKSMPEIYRNMEVSQ